MTSRHEGPQAWVALVTDTHPEPVSHTFPELQAWAGLVRPREGGIWRKIKKSREMEREGEKTQGPGEPAVAWSPGL